MKSSYKIFQIFGISVELHITFILFFMFLFTISFLEAGFLSGIATIFIFFMIFTIVFLHELLHSFVAIKNGIPVQRIILLPIGGLANVEIPEKPEKELVIAISGPLLNFSLAFLSAFLLVFLFPNPIDLFQKNLPHVISLAPDTISFIFTLPGILSALIFFNLSLGFFNMLPGFPMDGGRVFRAVLALWIDYVKATEIAVRFGQFIFLCMMFFGFISGSFMLLIIGMFLFFASGSELNIVKLSHSVYDLKIGAIAIRNFVYVNESITIPNFLEFIVKPDHRYYLVINNDGKLLGILDLYKLMEAKNEELFKKTVRDFISSAYVVDAEAKLKDKIQEVLSKDFVIVALNGKVVGYLTPQYIIDVANLYNILHQK